MLRASGTSRADAAENQMRGTGSSESAASSGPVARDPTGRRDDPAGARLAARRAAQPSRRDRPSAGRGVKSAVGPRGRVRRAPDRREGGQAPRVQRERGAISTGEPAYDAVLGDIVSLLEAGRRLSARAVNAAMTAAYWGVGQRIVEQEQRGHARAGYGEELVELLAADLPKRFGRGFGRRNLFQMKAFYLAYPPIVQTLSAQ